MLIKRDDGGKYIEISKAVDNAVRVRIRRECFNFPPIFQMNYAHAPLGSRPLSLPLAHANGSPPALEKECSSLLWPFRAHS